MNVCTNMYVRTFVCMYVCMLVRMYLHVHICMSVYVRTYVCVYECGCTSMYVCMYICMYAQSIDLEVERKNWPHPADVVAFIEVKEYDDKTIQIYTDGSKNEQGVGAGVAIFSGKELASKLKYKLDNRCSNNQAEQLAIAKALEALETTDIEENSPRTAAIITDSRISLDSIKL